MLAYLLRPCGFGPLFKQPTAKALKRLRAQQRIEGTNKDFSPAEIHKLLKYATPQIRAMILLGVNCGFGNHDCARLPLLAVDLDDGWVAFPRPKTGAARRCPIWPETAKALQEVLEIRRTPMNAGHADLVFITAHAQSFAKEHGCQSISHSFGDLAGDVGLKRTGRGFYSLRHVFRTVAGGAKDVEATRHIMGHDSSDVEDAYIEGIDDDRLKAVSDHVRAWLYAKHSTRTTGKTTARCGRRANRPAARTDRSALAAYGLVAAVLASILGPEVVFQSVRRNSPPRTPAELVSDVHRPQLTSLNPVANLGGFNAELLREHRRGQPQSEFGHRRSSCRPARTVRRGDTTSMRLIVG